MTVSAGMFNASTGKSGPSMLASELAHSILPIAAFLPSSFAMHFIMLGWSYAIEPATAANKERTIKAAMAFAVAVVLGWPFTVILALPFVLEELLLSGRDFSLSIPKRIVTLAQGAVPALGLVVSLHAQSEVSRSVLITSRVLLIAGTCLWC